MYVFVFVFLFFLLWPCLWTWNVLGNSSLLWAVCLQYTAVGFVETLKPSIGLFHNGSILSFALVQGLDPESFVCNWILCRFRVVITWYHITVGWRANQGEMTGERSNLWMCLHSLEIESEWTMATWQIRTELLLHFHGVELNWALQGCFGVYLSVVVVTALQW